MWKTYARRVRDPFFVVEIDNISDLEEEIRYLQRYRYGSGLRRYRLMYVED